MIKQKKTLNFILAIWPDACLKIQFDFGGVWSDLDSDSDSGYFGSQSIEIEALGT
jgi:hypothetical protein